LVNRLFPSKLAMIWLLMLILIIWSRNLKVSLTEVGWLWNGVKISVNQVAHSWLKLPVQLRMSRKGVLILWIFGNPYKEGVATAVSLIRWYSSWLKASQFFSLARNRWNFVRLSKLLSYDQVNSTKSNQNQIVGWSNQRP